jgi:8-oxo-dGTP diphosphatase
MSGPQYLAVCCAVIRDGARILIVQRPEQKADALKWEFPGGKVEAEESEEDCIKREIREELGVEIRLHGRLRSSFLQNQTKAIKLIGYLATVQSGTLELKEHKAARWVLPEELASVDVCEADRELVAILGEQALEETGWWQGS